MFNLLIIAIFLLIIFDICFRYQHKKNIEKKILQQNYVNEMAKIKYRILELAYNGDINKDSSYFTFMYTATRYLIRGLWVHGINEKIADLNIIQHSLYNFCPENKTECENKCLFLDEIRNLNNEQTNYFCHVNHVILDVYKNSSLLNLVLYNIFRFIYSKNKLVLIMNLPLLISAKNFIKKLIPETTIQIYQSFKKINEYSSYKSDSKHSACYAY